MDQAFLFGAIVKFGIWDQSLECWAAGKAYSHAIGSAISRVAGAKHQVVYLERNVDTSKTSNVLQIPNRRSLSVGQRALRKCLRIFGSREYDPYLASLERYLIGNRIDAVIGFVLSDRWAFSHVKTVSWIPDLQEKQLPNYFSENELRQRDELNRIRIECSSSIMVSSDAVQNDFYRYFKEYSPRVLRFRFPSHYAFVNTPLDMPDSRVLQKFGIDSPFFLVINQFWMHKNHTSVLKAVDLVRKLNGAVPRVVMIGQTNDYRDVAGRYLSALLQQRSILRLDGHVKILGFVSEPDKDALLRTCTALIQPSLCEGWNTSVEDAKALGIRVIASDISTHREQLGDIGMLFDPTRPDVLAEQMSMVMQNPIVWSASNEFDANKNYREISNQEAQRFLDSLVELVANGNMKA